MSFANLYKNIQNSISYYHDIGTIFAKLESQNHLQKLSNLISEIFQEEHDFTINGNLIFSSDLLSELKRYAADVKQNDPRFIEEQYDLNAGIFRRNLALIVQNVGNNKYIISKSDSRRNRKILSSKSIA